MFMPFGKHKGKSIEEIPADYLRWILDNCDSLEYSLEQEIRSVVCTPPEQTELYRQGFEAGKLIGWQRGWNAGFDRAKSDVSAAPAVGEQAIAEWRRAMAKRFHPDFGGSHDAMKAANVGAELLIELIRKK